MTPPPDEIAKIAEAKASRDVLVHSRGVASNTYESKAGNLARYKDGQRVDIPEHYHRETWELLRKVVTGISNAAIAKHEELRRPRAILPGEEGEKGRSRVAKEKWG